MYQLVVRDIDDKKTNFVHPRILFRMERGQGLLTVKPSIARRIKNAKLFLIYEGFLPSVKTSVDLNCVGLQLSTAISLVTNPDTFNLKRGSKESLKYFTIVCSLAHSNILLSSQLHSRKFLTDEEIGFLKLTEEPDLVICETDERCKYYNRFNISTITFFQAHDKHTWITSVCKYRKVFTEGSFHHALKTQFSKQFGLRYISARALKKQRLIQ